MKNKMNVNRMEYVLAGDYYITVLESPDKKFFIRKDRKSFTDFFETCPNLTVSRKNHIFVIYYEAVKCQIEEENMAVTYKKLFHLLIDRGISASELTELAGFSANILTRLRRDQYVSLDSIEKICLALDCKVDDILDFVPTEKE